VIVLLQIFSWFWQWKNFENRLIFDELKAYKKWCHFWGPPYIVQSLAKSEYTQKDRSNCPRRLRLHGRCRRKGRYDRVWTRTKVLPVTRPDCRTLNAVKLKPWKCDLFDLTHQVPVTTTDLTVPDQKRRSDLRLWSGTVRSVVVTDWWCVRSNRSHFQGDPVNGRQLTLFQISGTSELRIEFNDKHQEWAYDTDLYELVLIPVS